MSERRLPKYLTPEQLEQCRDAVMKLAPEQRLELTVQLLMDLLSDVHLTEPLPKALADLPHYPLAAAEIFVHTYISWQDRIGG